MQKCIPPIYTNGRSSYDVTPPHVATYNGSRAMSIRLQGKRNASNGKTPLAVQIFVFLDNVSLGNDF